MSSIPEFTLRSNNILQFGDFYISNAVLASFITSLVVLALAFWCTSGAGVVPTRRQLFLEMVVEFFHKMLKTAYGSDKRARKYLAYVVTLFLFLLIANQFSLLPVITSLTTDAGPLFRTSTSDWSQTIALALISLGAAHLIALTASPLKHIGSFIKLGPLLKVRKPSDLGNALLELFLGILDIIGELAKVLSMSARLFGNIFAGEVLIAVIGGLSIYTSFLIPVPFIALSIFSGLVQAFVFTLLALQFMAGTVTNVAPTSLSEEEEKELSPKIA